MSATSTSFADIFKHESSKIQSPSPSSDSVWKRDNEINARRFPKKNRAIEISGLEWIWSACVTCTDYGFLWRESRFCWLLYNKYKSIALKALIRFKFETALVEITRDWEVERVMGCLWVSVDGELKVGEHKNSGTWRIQLRTLLLCSFATYTHSTPVHSLVWRGARERKKKSKSPTTPCSLTL